MGDQILYSPDLDSQNAENSHILQVETSKIVGVEFLSDDYISIVYLSTKMTVFHLETMTTSYSMNMMQGNFASCMAISEDRSAIGICISNRDPSTPTDRNYLVICRTDFEGDGYPQIDIVNTTSVIDDCSNMVDVELARLDMPEQPYVCVETSYNTDKKLMDIFLAYQEPERQEFKVSRMLSKNGNMSAFTNSSYCDRMFVSCSENGSLSRLVIREIIVDNHDDRLEEN